MIPDHTAFFKIINKKQDYMHLEGISHAAYALNAIGHRQEQLGDDLKETWAAL